MLTDNFRRLVIDFMRVGTQPASPAFVITTGEVKQVQSNRSYLNSMQVIAVDQYSPATIGSNTKGFFMLGTGTAPAQPTDYTLANEISDYSNLTVDSFTNLNNQNQGLGAKLIMTQNFTYSGNEELTITEIGFAINTSVGSNYERGVVLMAREVISPITIHTGDTFSVQMTIG